MRKLYIFLAIALFAAILPCPSHAEDLQLAEQKIKAGLLYNFLKYTIWPGSPANDASPIMVCMYGGDPFGGNLQPMQGRSVNQRPIVLNPLKDPGKMATCNLLLINPAEKDKWPQLQTALAGKNILTVSDFEGFAASGGMIEFKLKDSHVEATLNILAVKKAHLQVEGRLLKLVTVMNPAAGDSQ